LLIYHWDLLSGRLEAFHFTLFYAALLLKSPGKAGFSREVSYYLIDIPMCNIQLLVNRVAIHYAMSTGLNSVMEWA
jgi:hypothetical protein